MVIAKTCKAEAISDSVRGEGLESNKSFVFDDAACDMVWPITGANSYVCKTGKSMKAEELAVPRGGSWRNIPFTLIDPVLRAPHEKRGTIWGTVGGHRLVKAIRNEIFSYSVAPRRVCLERERARRALTPGQC
jgi:hypothetical protein